MAQRLAGAGHQLTPEGIDHFTGEVRKALESARTQGHDWRVDDVADARFAGFVTEADGQQCSTHELTGNRTITVTVREANHGGGPLPLK